MLFVKKKIKKNPLVMISYCFVKTCAPLRVVSSVYVASDYVITVVCNQRESLPLSYRNIIIRLVWFLGFFFGT